ncbi:MAG: glycogen synthase GlgA [Acidobacteriota bacterium]
MAQSAKASAVAPGDVQPQERPRSVLLIGSEAVPFAKTGGLADVLGILPVALAGLGWSATLVLPRYRGITAGRLVEHFPISIGAYTREVGFYEVPLADGANAILVDCPDLFDRDALYGVDGADYADSPRRSALLVRAALEYAGRRESGPSLVHAHDWQAGLTPVYLKTLYASHPLLGARPCVFTIHNLAYQGLCEPDWLPRLDLPWELFAVDQMEFWGRVSLLKGGINEADILTTVSRQYAREIQTPEFGFGFDGVLRRRSADLVGVLNGIDTTEWDPARDRFLPAGYDADNVSGKAASKRELLTRFGLGTSHEALGRPIIGMISRMVEQKGFDLLEAMEARLASFEATWVVLGTGDTRYQQFWTRMASRYPDRICVRIGFSEELAHLIEAGADLFLMPSRFEPCGLNQMYSMRYGTVPLVHGVGGLLDTVHDFGAGDANATGFVFLDYTPAALGAALERALSVFEDRQRWRGLQLAGMRQDNSWHRSALEYVRIYERAIRARAEPRL